jgi:hypothetical protein
MGISLQHQVSVGSVARDLKDEPAPGGAVAMPTTNLAALLDQFTQSVTQPHAHSVGEFAATVGALHGELAMLARHFGADATEPETIDFDDIFPLDGALSKDFEGVAAEEELEHVCRELSR